MCLQHPPEKYCITGTTKFFFYSKFGKVISRSTQTHLFKKKTKFTTKQMVNFELQLLTNVLTKLTRISLNYLFRYPISGCSVKQQSRNIKMLLVMVKLLINGTGKFNTIIYKIVLELHRNSLLLFCTKNTRTGSKNLSLPDYQNFLQC